MKRLGSYLAGAAVAAAALLLRRSHRRTRESARRILEDARALERRMHDRTDAEQRFYSALDSSAVAFDILRAVRDSRGRIVDFEWQYLNAAAAKIIKRTPGQVIGRSVGQTLPGVWAAAPGLFDAFVRAIQTGEPQSLEVESNLEELSGLFHNIATRFEDGVAVWFTDVTAHRQAEQQALHARNQLQTVTDLMATGVAHIGRDMRYIWVNSSYARMFGRKPEQFVGCHVREIVGNEVYDTFEPRYREVLAGQRVEFEDRFAPTGDEMRWYFAAYVPSLSRSGVVESWVTVVMDITRRKNLEAAILEEGRRKDEFLAMLAHELRNPLAPIRSALEVLRLTEQHPDDRAQLARAIMDRQLRHMSRLVDDLLDVSRITQGRIQLHKERVGVDAIVTQAVEASRPLIEANAHKLTVSLPLEPLIVEADVTRMAQVIGNLLNNAAKYTPRGGRIALTVTQEEAAVAISVEDTGIGVPAEMLSKIFDMFVQVDRSLERAQGGLGIGLTLVQRLVAMHGGQVEARSAGPGKGSEFIIRLGLVPQPQNHAGRPAPAVSSH